MPELRGRRDRLEANFEHGRWWVIGALSGAAWSVSDGDGPSSSLGFCFERVSQGEEGADGR